MNSSLTHTLRRRLCSTPARSRTCWWRVSFSHHQNTRGGNSISKFHYATARHTPIKTSAASESKQTGLEGKERESSGNGNAIISFAVIEISVRSENKHPGRYGRSVLVCSWAILRDLVLDTRHYGQNKQRWALASTCKLSAMLSQAIDLSRFKHMKYKQCAIWSTPSRLNVVKRAQENVLAHRITKMVVKWRFDFFFKIQLFHMMRAGIAIYQSICITVEYLMFPIPNS